MTQRKKHKELPTMTDLSQEPCFPSTSAGASTSKKSQAKKLARGDKEAPATAVDLTAKQKQDIKDAFNAFDTGGTGFMNVSDLKIALRAMGFEPKAKDIKKLVESVDKGGTGKLSFNDFTDVIATKMAEKDTREEIMKAFKLFDRDQTGFITVDNLKQIAVELGEGLAEEEVVDMIQEADLDGDGAVNQEEFFRIMKKTSLY